MSRQVDTVALHAFGRSPYCPGFAVGEALRTRRIRPQGLRGFHLALVELLVELYWDRRASPKDFSNQDSPWVRCSLSRCPYNSMMDRTAWLLLCRNVRFGETDAAGVMHFHHLLRWCHEAYEESLDRFGIAPTDVFPAPGSPLEVALPIVHTAADYLRPLVNGDPLAIELQPRRLDRGSFEVCYEFRCKNKAMARALTRHQAIDSNTRRRTDLPVVIRNWLAASVPEREDDVAKLSTPWR